MKYIWKQKKINPNAFPNGPNESNNFSSLYFFFFLCVCYSWTSRMHAEHWIVRSAEHKNYFFLIFCIRKMSVRKIARDHHTTHMYLLRMHSNNWLWPDFNGSHISSPFRLFFVAVVALPTSFHLHTEEVKYNT